jgi:hypothetical protein
MLSVSATEYAQKAPHLVFFPGVAISLAVFGSNLWATRSGTSSTRGCGARDAPGRGARVLESPRVLLACR